MPSTFIEELECRTLFAFGVTTTSTTYVIDNGGDLKFTVLKNGAATSSTVHLGDITSIQYKGQEMMASFADSGRYSHYEQGLGSTSVISYTIGGNNSWILVTCDDSAASSGGVIQYYAVRKGDNNIYMASLPTDVTNGPGEGRFIGYLSRTVFPTPEAPSDNAGTTGAIEGSDVFGHADGTTTSKFYNMGREMIDNVYHGVTGSAGGQSVGAWIFMGDREHSAGGPFFKDIDFQSSDSQVEIYNCLFTGHTQTEAFRQGLQGPYAFQFTDGTTPVQPDYSWLEGVTDSSGQLLISGLIPMSQRGTLSGKASGVPAGHRVTVGLSNTTAQYWGTPDASGNYTIPGIQPGTYTETLYDNELEVGTRTITITAGATTRADMADTYFTPNAASTIWQIGTWDGTPGGFLNSDKISIMHPSDVRMASWTSTSNFVIGTNADADWPLVQFMGVNNSQRITFTLTAAQASTALTLRIGITLGFEGGRNRVTVNSGQSYAWTSAIPAASRDLNSRGITRGTWRGTNQLYTYNIPTSALRAGTNTIDLPVVSGSYVSGQTWLSPNVVYDAIDLVTTSSLTNAPKVTTITLSPANSNVAPNGQKQFTATVKDQFGNAMPANLVWSATAGMIDDTGLFTAPASGGATITATSGTASGSTAVTVLADSAPTIATHASATPNPTNGTSAALSVLAADDNGESGLTYTWAAVGTPPDPVTFSANGTNAAKNVTATFTKAGTYTLQVTVTDAGGLSATDSVTVTVGLGAFTDSRDVGAPATAGSLSYAPATGTYTIKGGGADIWGTADQFRYNYVTFGGGGTVAARVVSTTNTNSNAKAGVMIRDSAAANAAYAFAWLSPGNIVKFETRAANGVSSVYSAAVSAGTAPVWVRIVRSGAALDQFAAAYSLNGTTWTQVGATQTVTMATTAAVAGLAVTSHNNTAGSLNTAVFDNVSIAATVTGDQTTTGQPDAIRLARNGSYVDVYLNNATSTPTYRYDYSSLGSLAVSGAGGDDVLTLDYAGGSPVPAGGVSFDGGSGANRLVISGTAAGGDNVTVSGGTVSLSGGNAFGGIGLTVTTGAVASLEAATRLRSLTLAGGRFDVNGDNLLIDYAGASPVATLRQSLRTADLFSSTNVANHAVGYAEASDLGLTSFLGQPVDTTALLYQYTWAGDANLDGKITSDDYALADRGKAKGLGTWVFGDFDYDGAVTQADYAILNQSASAASAPAPTAPAVASAPAVTPTDDLASATVPPVTTADTASPAPAATTAPPATATTPAAKTTGKAKSASPKKPAKRAKAAHQPATVSHHATPAKAVFSSVPIRAKHPATQHLAHAAVRRP